MPDPRRDGYLSLMALLTLHRGDMATLYEHTASAYYAWGGEDTSEHAVALAERALESWKAVRASYDKIIENLERGISAERLRLKEARRV